MICGRTCDWVSRARFLFVRSFQFLRDPLHRGTVEKGRKFVFFPTTHASTECILPMMTCASGVCNITGSSLPKWQFALAVGAPVAIGLGYMYYKGSVTSASKPDCGKAKGGGKKDGLPRDKTTSIDAGESADVSPSSKSKAKTPYAEALEYKDKGNEYFKASKYDKAIAQYSKAIEICPKEHKLKLATFYQNRAAAYEFLGRYSAVKWDCTKALELNPKYIKALQRRARAFEREEDLESVLEDVTAACILEQFSNQSTLVMADRVLKELGREHAEQYMETKKPLMPSKYFIKTYFNNFGEDPIFSVLDASGNTDDAISPFAKIKEALREERYNDVIPLCTQELESLGPEESPHKMVLLLLRSTFNLLLGEDEDAFQDLKTIIESEKASKKVKVNALIKRALMHMQWADEKKCFADFRTAVKLDPDCSYIYHHRGQVNLLLQKVDEARADAQRAVDLNPNFGVGYGQKCYTDYRYAVAKRNVEVIGCAIRNFKEAFTKFPDCSECYTLYAHVLCNTNNYAKADSYFAEAIEKNPDDVVIYVHRGRLQLQWDGDMEKAVAYINKALEMDDKCQFAYETLGTIEVQRGNLKRAIELFDKALPLARSVLELTHIFSMRDAAKTQLSVMEKLGVNLV